MICWPLRRDLPGRNTGLLLLPCEIEKAELLAPSLIGFVHNAGIRLQEGVLKGQDDPGPGEQVVAGLLEDECSPSYPSNNSA